ncbi:MAG: hypothetical protein Q8O94_02870 [bacterium]|nr:hypothetical protein [bacterium]
MSEPTTRHEAEKIEREEIRFEHRGISNTLILTPDIIPINPASKRNQEQHVIVSWVGKFASRPDVNAVKEKAYRFSRGIWGLFHMFPKCFGKQNLAEYHVPSTWESKVFTHPEPDSIKVDAKAFYEDMIGAIFHHYEQSARCQYCRLFHRCVRVKIRQGS